MNQSNIDWSSKSWIVDTTYIKASTAALIKRPSAASALSQLSPMHDSLLVMDQMPPPLEDKDKYTLNDLTCSVASNHLEASKNVKRWLGRHRDTEIKTEEALPNAPGLETTSHMRPDVFYTYNHEGEVNAVLIIEIDSKELESTCRKLAYALIEQALGLRRYDNTILEVAGYYFPSYQRRNSVVRVTLTWNDEYLRFIASRMPLPANDVAGRVKEDLERGIRRWRRMSSGSPTRFVLPLTSSFVHDNFGEDSVQIMSGHSVVILNPRRSKILKCNFCFGLATRLHELFLMPQARDALLERSLLPNGTVVVGPKTYFTFKLLLKPIDRYEARGVFGGVDGFADGVFNALRELHDTCSLAHMDLRLENVCFDPGTRRPILIDLDRSARKASGVTHYNLPSTSTMYKPLHTNWVLENIDLLQMGLMFCYILDKSIDNSYDRGTFDYNRDYPTSIHPYLHSLLVGQWPSALEHANFISDPKFLCN